MAKETWQQREAREAAERQLVAQTIPQVAKLLAAVVDDREGHSVQIRHSDFVVHVYHNTWKGRLHLSGTFPTDLERHRIKSGSRPDPECAITVSVHRPAQHIANAIRRLIVPVYRQLYPVLAERNARYTKSETAKEQQADRIAYAGRGQRLGERDPWRQHEHYPTRYVTFGGQRWGSRQPCGEAEITGVDQPSISMKLYNLTPELAEYIAALFGEWAED